MAIIIVILLAINILFWYLFYKRWWEEKKEIWWNKIKYTTIYAIWWSILDVLTIIVILMITYSWNIEGELSFYLRPMILALLFNKWLNYLLIEDILFRWVYSRDIHYTYIIWVIMILLLLLVTNTLNWWFTIELIKTSFIAIIWMILIMIFFWITSHLKLLFIWWNWWNINKKEDDNKKNTSKMKSIKEEELSWFEKLTNIWEWDFLLIPVFISYLVTLYLLIWDSLTLKQIGIMLMLYFFITAVIAVIYYIYLLIKYFIQNKKEIVIPPLYVGLIPAIYMTLIVIVITWIFSPDSLF